MQVRKADTGPRTTNNSNAQQVPIEHEGVAIEDDGVPGGVSSGEEEDLVVGQGIGQNDGDGGNGVGVEEEELQQGDGMQEEGFWEGVT